MHAVIQELLVKGQIKTSSQMKSTKISTIEPSKTGEVLKIIQDPEYRRHMSTIDINVAIKKYNKQKDFINQEEERIAVCVADFKQDLLCLGIALK